MRYLYVAAWKWQSDAEGGRWEPPVAGNVGMLDLRPLPAQGDQSGASQGPGLFVYPGPVDIPDSLSLGGELDRVVDTAERDSLRARLDISEPLEGASLVEVLWNILTLHADPRGEARPKPLMPTTGGTLELHLGGFSRVKSKRFSTALPEWPVILESLRDQYRRIRQSRLGAPAAGQTHRKALGTWLRKYGVADYRIFIPADLPDEGMLAPATTYTEDWNAADSTSISNDLTWTEVRDDLEIHSNACKNVGNVASALLGAQGRAEHDLSGDDHYAQADCSFTVEAGNRWTGLACRFSTDASPNEDFYYGAHGTTGTDTYILAKIVNGARTVLATVSTTSPGTGAVLDRLEADGSNLTFKSGGTTRIGPTSDTSLSGQLRCGIWGNGNGARRNVWDNFEAGDLAAAAAGRSQSVIIA